MFCFYEFYKQTRTKTYYESILVWRQQMRFALLARCLISSFTCRFLFSSSQSVVKSNVTVFVYTKREKQNYEYSFGRSVYALTVK